MEDRTMPRCLSGWWPSSSGSREGARGGKAGSTCVSEFYLLPLLMMCMLAGLALIREVAKIR